MYNFFENYGDEGLVPRAIGNYNGFPLNTVGPKSIPSLINWWSAQLASSLNGGTFADGDAITSWTDPVGGKSWVPHGGTAAPLIKLDGYNNRRTISWPGDVNRVLQNSNGNALYGAGSVARSVYWVTRFNGNYVGGFAYLGAFEIDGAGNDVLYGFSSTAGYSNFTFGGKAAGGKVPNIHSTTFPANGMLLACLTDDGLNSTPGSMALYERGTQYTVTAGSDDTDTTSVNILGSWTTTGANGFVGDLCELLIFSTVLSSAQRAILDNYFEIDQNGGYFFRDGGTSPIFAPGGAASASGFTPNLGNARLSQATAQNDVGGLMKNGTDLWAVYYQENSGAPRAEKWNYSNPASPTLTDTLPAVGGVAPFSMTRGPGDFAFIPLYKSSQVCVIDVTKALSTSACIVDTLSAPASPNFVWTWGNYFVICGGPENPGVIQIHHYKTAVKDSVVGKILIQHSDAIAISITSDGYLYILSSGVSGSVDAHLYVYDILTSLANLTLVAELNFPGVYLGPVWMEAVGNRLCFTDFQNNKMHVVDITNRRSTPVQLSSTTVPTGPVQVGMFGNYVAVLCQVAGVVNFWDISAGSVTPGDAPTHLGDITPSTPDLQCMYLDIPNKLLHVGVAHPTGSEGVFDINRIETWSLA